MKTNPHGVLAVNNHLSSLTGLSVSDAQDRASLLDHMSEGVVVRCGREIVYLNDAIVSMMGLEPEEAPKLTSVDINEWIHPDDRQTVDDHYDARVSYGGDAKPYSIRLVRPDGSIFWVSIKAVVTQWHGKTAVAGFMSDITAQMESEDKEQFSTNLFRSVFKVTPDFMLLFRLDSDEVFAVNPSFLNLFGHRRDDVIGAPVQSLNLWSDITFHERFIEELKTTASISDMPTTMNARGGVLRHFKLFARRVEGSTLPFVLMTGRDVTDDISKSQELQRNRDAAELANRSKSEFLANMSHELRTPLNAILGFSELIRDQIGGPDAVDRYSDYAQDIHKSGHHLLSIINDILDLSKVEAGRLEAHMEWIDPQPGMAMCIKLMQQRALKAGVTLAHTIDDNAQLYADERLFKQMCLNLVSNAVKFTEVNGRVQISLITCDDGTACLTVSDSGIGMTAAELQVAKRPFGQVDSSLSRKQEGSGLGLPLVVSFAEKLGCEFTIDSAPGKGTLARLMFPAKRVRSKGSDPGT